MKLAFLSDIHANLPALGAVLDAVGRLRVQKIYIAGDIVGGGPHPVEVVRGLQGVGATCVAGNVDRKVIALLESPHKIRKCLAKANKAHLAWTAKQLGPFEAAWLKSLPPKQDFQAGPVAVRLVHGSAESDEDYIFPSVTAEALSRKTGGFGSGVFVCGHSHIPFTKAVGQLRLINCGSVGRPVDGDPGASFAVLDISRDGRTKCTIVRCPYPVQHLLDDLAARQVPGAIGEEYLAGIKRRGV